MLSITFSRKKVVADIVSDQWLDDFCFYSAVMQYSDSQPIALICAL